MFPGAKYPLHIFEEKYKRLINRCIATEDGFGIISKNSDKVSEVGCFVRVSRILKKYDNGNMDIIVTGLYRFRIIAIQELSDRILEAEIEEFSDYDQIDNHENLGTEAMDQFQKIIDKTSLYLSDTFWNNLSTTRKKSFKLAEKSGLNIEQQQTMLSMRSESKRLEFLIQHFTKVIEYLDRSDTLKEIISGDGYINE